MFKKEDEVLGRNLSNLISTFLIFSIILLFVAAVTGLDYFEDDFSFDSDNLSFTVFGKTFNISKNIPKAADRLLSFNDKLFGNGFSDFSKECANTVFSFAGDVTKIIYGFIKGVTG